jgi:hypothetical protein
MAPKPATPMGGSPAPSSAPKPAAPGSSPMSGSPQPYRPSWARDDEDDL